MVHYVAKEIKGHTYWYLHRSERQGDKVKSFYVAYVGKRKPTTSAEAYYSSKKKELGTTMKKEEPKMDWYQPALLPDGTYLAQNRAKTKKYTYKINWGISNPYHLKVYFEDHLIYENKLKTKREMREALEEQLVVMNRMDAQKAELGTTTRTTIKEEYDKLAEEHYARGGVVDIPELRNRVKRRIKIKRSDFDNEIIDMSKEGEFDLQYHFQPTQKEVKKGILQPKGLAYFVLDREKVKELGTTK